MTTPPVGRRLVDEVRRLGMETAAEIAARFSRLVEPLESGGDSRFDRLAGDLVEATVAILRVMQDLAEIAGVSPPEAGGPARLTVPVPEPGGTGTATLWAHNTSREPATLRLAASDLVGPGGRIPGTAVTFEPARLDGLGPGESRAVAVRVRIHPGIRPGPYQGVVGGMGSPGAALALTVAVGPDR